MSNISRIQPDTTKQTPQLKGLYIAQISQAGTDAPTTIVIKNTLPTTGMPVWTRSATGVYLLTSPVSNYFPAGLVVYWITMNGIGGQAMRLDQTSTEIITLVTAASNALADSILAFTPIRIEIWDRLQD